VDECSASRGNECPEGTPANGQTQCLLPAARGAHRERRRAVCTKRSTRARSYSGGRPEASGSPAVLFSLSVARGNAPACMLGESSCREGGPGSLPFLSARRIPWDDGTAIAPRAVVKGGAPYASGSQTLAKHLPPAPVCRSPVGDYLSLSQLLVANDAPHVLYWLAQCSGLADRTAESGAAPPARETVMVIRAQIALALVLLLPAAMYALFQAYRHFFSKEAAHLLGMLSYWVLLLVISFAVLSAAGISRVLASHGALNPWLWVLLALPVALSLAFGPFVKQLSRATLLVFLLSAVLAVINGTLEELFWRGVYVDTFPGLWLAWLWPAIGFAIWHLAPLSVMPYRNGAVRFVLGSLLLGLCWGFVAFTTKSIAWTIVSHVIVDLSGFGALLYVRRG
jgi:uncharacterized protein